MYTPVNKSYMIEICVHRKVPGPISQNGDIESNDASSSKKSWFQISVLMTLYQHPEAL